MKETVRSNVSDIIKGLLDKSVAEGRVKPEERDARRLAIDQTIVGRDSEKGAVEWARPLPAPGRLRCLFWMVVAIVRIQRAIKTPELPECD